MKDSARKSSFLPEFQPRERKFLFFAIIPGVMYVIKLRIAAAAVENVAMLKYIKLQIALEIFVFVNSRIC